MSVRTEQPSSTRAMVETTTLPSGSSIGITVTENTADATTYDGQTFNNVLYSSSDGINWTTTDAPALSATDAKAVAYYPYSDAVTDVTAIPVTAGETDYMYSGYLTGLSATNPEAAFTMNHAMTALRVNLKKSAEYAPTATVTDITIKGAAFGTAATLNATTGALTSITGQDADISRTLSLPLTSSYQTNDFIVVPDAAATDLTLQFLVTINDEQYTASTTLTEALKQGYYYTFSLTLSAKGISVSIASVKPWNSGAAMESDLAEYNPWENMENGVYAVSASGEPVAIADADETCIGVALIVKDAPTPQYLMIEKNGEANTTSIQAAYTADGATDTGYKYFYWGVKGSDIENINNYTQTGGGGTEYDGYLPKADGTYYLTPNLSDDYTTWTDGALSDFNGKANTAAIQAATDTDSYTTYANMGTWCVKFNQTVSENQGYTDWYIPACGQLALIYLNRTEIGRLLHKIGGQGFYGDSLGTSFYWSSSERSNGYGWCLCYWNGLLDYGGYYETSAGHVRFVRNLIDE